MTHIRIATLLIMAAGITLLLGGCGTSYWTRNSELTELLLINPSILVKDSNDQSIYNYDNPKVKLRNYNKVIVEPVILSKAAELDSEEMENYQQLVNNAYVYLTEELKKDYRLVRTPEPGTLRIQMALIEADPSKPVRNLLTTVIPTDSAIDLVKFAATGKPMSVGEISGEFKITDASSGRLLGASLDRRIGKQALKGSWDSWDNTGEALKYWAQRARYVLCEKKIGPFCEKP